MKKVKKKKLNKRGDLRGVHTRSNGHAFKKGIVNYPNKIPGTLGNKKKRYPRDITIMRSVARDEHLRALFRWHDCSLEFFKSIDEELMNREMTVGDALAFNIWQRALKGERADLEHIANRLFGPIKKLIEIGRDDSPPEFLKLSVTERRKVRERFQTELGTKKIMDKEGMNEDS